jgi:hypothetical protein
VDPVNEVHLVLFAMLARRAIIVRPKSRVQGVSEWQKLCHHAVSVQQADHQILSEDGRAACNDRQRYVLSARATKDQRPVESGRMIRARASCG